MHDMGYKNRMYLIIIVTKREPADSLQVMSLRLKMRSVIWLDENAPRDFSQQITNMSILKDFPGYFISSLQRNLLFMQQRFVSPLLQY